MSDWGKWKTQFDQVTDFGERRAKESTSKKGPRYTAQELITPVNAVDYEPTNEAKTAAQRLRWHINLPRRKNSMQRPKVLESFASVDTKVVGGPAIV